MAELSSSYHHGDLRDALLGEAEAMIAEAGTDSVTMRELGRRIGVSRSAAYRHFPDKSALLEGVAANGFARLRERLESVERRGELDGAMRLRALAEAYLRFALEHPGQYRLMYGREAVSRADRPELRETGNALFDHIVSVIADQQEAGLVRPGDPKIQAYVAWSTVHGLASLLLGEQILAPVDVERLIDTVSQSLLEGLGA